MSLPAFRSLAARRQERRSHEKREGTGSTSDGASSPLYVAPPRVDMKRATRTRRNYWIMSSALISVIFLILTIIGNINSKAVIHDIYFFKLDLTNIIPANADNITFVNSLARSLGLHDFYQVGLWNFCEGYNGEGITHCSKPQSFYWFNPVEILLNE